MILRKKKILITLIMLTAFFQVFYYNISLNASEPIFFRSKTGCNAISPQTQPSVFIDGERYPKHVPWHHNDSIHFSCLNENRVIGKKRILLWTTFHGSPLKDDLESLILTNKSSEVFDLLRCPVNNCELTIHKSKLNQSSLVLFHLRNLIHRWPEYRAPDQRWVHMVYEPQTYCSQCDDYEGVFNMTASYRKESDFTSIYYSDSGIRWSDRAITTTSKNVFESKRKTGFGAALISNPFSRRTLYIQNLQNYINITIYGNIEGAIQCPDHVNLDRYQIDQSTKCREYIASAYKFFFSFENSMCTDYITEKFFDMLKYDIVPVVMGKAEYDFWVPRSAYINALDFDSPQDLAAFLANLSEDENAYNKYFEWKKFLNFDKTPPYQGYLCDMCIKLNVEEVTGVVEKKRLESEYKLYNPHQNCYEYDVDHKNIKLGHNLYIHDAMSAENNFSQWEF